MGNQNKKSTKNKTNIKFSENRNESNITKNLIRKNPIFKNIQTISKNLCMGFEVYQLKSKNNSLYIAFYENSHESKWIIFINILITIKFLKKYQG